MSTIAIFYQPQAVRDKFLIALAVLFSGIPVCCSSPFNQSFYYIRDMSLTGCQASICLSLMPPASNMTLPFRLSWWRRSHLPSTAGVLCTASSTGAHRYPFYSAAGGRRRRALGRVFCAVFHRWVREDIRHMDILLFSETLSAWCGETLTQPGAARRRTAPATAARGCACAAVANRKTRCARVTGSSTILAGPICE